MLKDEIKHFLLSIIAGVIIGYFFSNYWSIPIALLTGFFIDADHLIDYFIYRGWKFNLKEFLSGKCFDYSGKVYVFFHAFEYILVLVVAGLIWPIFNWIFFTLALSLLFHLLFDTFSNKPKWPTYFLSFRIYHHFNHKDFDFKC